MRIKLLGVFAVFLAPLLAAFIWYYGFGGASAARSMVNHAELLPPTAVAPFANVDGDSPNQVHTQSQLARKWHIVQIVAEPCDESCQRALYNTRQMRLALGRRAARVQRIIIAADRALINALQPAHRDALFLLESDNGLGKQLRAKMKNPLDAVVIDPNGNIIMRAAFELSPALLLKDFKKLLRLSRIG